jgi:hypothetical protein
MDPQSPTTYYLCNPVRRYVLAPWPGREDMVLLHDVCDELTMPLYAVRKKDVAAMYEEIVALGKRHGFYVEGIGGSAH